MFSAGPENKKNNNTNNKTFVDNEMIIHYIKIYTDYSLICKLLGTQGASGMSTITIYILKNVSASCMFFENGAILNF